MARIVAISSQVVRGHVGLSAIVPALQRLGHEVLGLPTVLFSNHPGHPRAAGVRVEVNTLLSMLEVLDANGWLTGIDAVMTGYLPSSGHVYFANEAVKLVRQRSPNAIVVVDPVIGDDPKGVYLDAAAAADIRDTLLPKADIATPNRFELGWLSGCAVASVADCVAAARGLGVPTLVATSVPGGSERLVTVAVTRESALACEVVRLDKVPHGTGDLLSGLLVGHLLRTGSLAESLARAVGGVRAAISASGGATDMVLASMPGDSGWALAEAAPVVEVGLDQ